MFIYYLYIIYLITMRMTRMSVSIDQEEQDFFRDHPEISPAKLMRKVVREYKIKLHEPLYEEEEVNA